jgi:hypothetical protein
MRLLKLKTEKLETTEPLGIISDLRKRFVQLIEARLLFRLDWLATIDDERFPARFLSRHACYLRVALQLNYLCVRVQGGPLEHTQDSVGFIINVLIFVTCGERGFQFNPHSLRCFHHRSSYDSRQITSSTCAYWC